MYMKSGEGDPHKIRHRLFADLHAAARREDPVRLARPDAGLDRRASTSSCCGTMPGAPYKTVKEFLEAAKAASPPFKMGGTGSKREDHILTVVHGEEDRREIRLPALQVRRRGGDPARRQPHRRPTSTTRPRISKSGAPARCARCACSTTSASTTRRRSRQTSPGTTSRPARKKGWTSSTRCCAAFPAGKVTPEQTAFYVDLFKKIAQTAGVSRTTWKSRR